MSRRVAILLTNDTNEYQRLIQRDAADAARRSDLQLELHVAGNDVAEQIRQFYGCVRRAPEEQPRFLMLFPVRDGSLEYALRDAARAGIGCAILNRRPPYLREMRAEFPGVPLGTISPDQVEMGRIQSRQAVALLPRGGFALYVMGPVVSSAAQDRLDGFRDGLRGNAIDHSVVHGDWDAELSKNAVLKWLRLVLVSTQRVDLVVCQNDAMALGAAAALETASREMTRPELARLKVTGIDGLPDLGQRQVTEGALAATIIQPSSGKPAVEWATSWLDGRKAPLDVTLPVTPFPPIELLRGPV